LLTVVRFDRSFFWPSFFGREIKLTMQFQVETNFSIFHLSIFEV